MEPEVSLPYFQEPNNGPYCESFEFCSHRDTLFIKDPFNTEDGRLLGCGGHVVC
jgi:hypothetical protein